MNPEKKQISFDDLGKFNDFIEKVKILDDYLSQLSSKSEFNKYEINLLSYKLEISKFENKLLLNFKTLFHETKKLYSTMSIDLKENLMIEKIKKNDICQNLLKLHRNNIERIQNENSEFLEKINKTNENNIFLKKHITFLEDSILYLEKILEELNEKIIKFWTQRFETYNEIFLKNLKEKKKTNQKIIQTLKFETQELRLMYEKRIDMKEQEIKMISENYKKRLYERFNAKVSFGMEEIENKEQTWIKENEKKAKKEEGNELKMKLIERETKLKKKQRRGNRKENLEEFNSKFYHLRK